MKWIRHIALFAAVICASSSFPQDIASKIDAAIRKADSGIARILALTPGERNFDNVLGFLDRLTAEFDSETSMGIFQQYVNPDSKIRDQSRQAEETVTNWYIEVGKREDLYSAINAYADTKPNLAGEQKRMLDQTIRDYKRSGMSLPKETRDRLKALDMAISKIGIEFETNIAEDKTKVPLNMAELKGVPQEVVDRLPKIGNTVLAGLDGPTYGAIMDYCSIEETRRKMQWLYRRRAPKNVEVLEQMLKLRDEKSLLLGYKNTVDYEVDVRMAKNSETVKKFYEQLLPSVKKKAEIDFAELQSAKRQFTKDKKAVLNPWDYAFFKNYLLAKKYAVDTQKVSEYFPMERVLEGLFTITGKLFSITYSDMTSQAGQLGFTIWHDDVKLYQIKDTASGKILGHMFTDLYPRENKYNHAACWGLTARRANEDGTVQLPVAALVCNFTKPTPTKPSLMPHDEVETFFHEFGHGLHNILSQAKYARFAGTSVARDFVEAPSQMLENWVWSAEALALFAKHYKTNEPIPAALVKGMKAAQSLGSGIETEGQMWLGMMDQAFHTAPKGEIDTTKACWDVYEQVMPYKRLPSAFSQASFGHLNGYQGAYYGYLWSLVYAQDMFGRFEEKGVLSEEAGRYYRDKVLGRGGTMDELDMLRDYLGREPNMAAFMRRLGLSGH